MNPRPSIHAAKRLRAGPSYWVLVAVAVCTLSVAGCGERKKDQGASQTAARINAEEVTVHQINLLLQKQRGLKPEQVAVASKQALEFLIDQELAVQRTRELKLDQEQRVILQLDAAKREVLARVYAESVGESVAKPTPEEVKKYYDDKPALFKERRVYSIQELSIEAAPEQVGVLRSQLQRAKSPVEFVDYLKANNVRFNANQGVRAAEQLPADLLDNLAKMKDGQMTFLPAPTGALMIHLVSSRSEPVEETRANPVIEQFLLNDAKRKRIEGDIKALRAAAKIAYVGKFAEGAASAPAGKTAQPTATAASPAAASGMSADDISKGLGIKK